MLRATGLPLRFVFLQGDMEVIAARMRERSGHYMPVSLLQSQFATLEDPCGEADVDVVPVGLAPAAQLERALAVL